MELLHSEYKDRIAHWQRVLAQDFYHPEGEIAFEGFTTMDHLTPEQAVDGGFRPVPVGTVWGAHMGISVAARYGHAAGRNRRQGRGHVAGYGR